MAARRIVTDTDGLVEDLTFLATHGVGLTEAAARVDFPSADALEKWLYRRSQHQLVARLRRLEPISLHPHAHREAC